MKNNMLVQGRVSMTVSFLLFKEEWDTVNPMTLVTLLPGTTYKRMISFLNSYKVVAKEEINTLLKRQFSLKAHLYKFAASSSVHGD